MIEDDCCSSKPGAGVGGGACPDANNVDLPGAGSCPDVIDVDSGPVAGAGSGVCPDARV